jgi:hypothetical protein
MTPRAVGERAEMMGDDSMTAAMLDRRLPDPMRPRHGKTPCVRVGHSSLPEVGQKGLPFPEGGRSS